MLRKLRGSGRTRAIDRERQPDRVARRGIRVLADDQHPHLSQGVTEGPQHVPTGWQVAATGRGLGIEKFAQRCQLPATGSSASAQPASISPMDSVRAR